MRPTLRIPPRTPLHMTIVGGACLALLWACYPAGHALSQKRESLQELPPLNVRAENPRGDGDRTGGAISFAATIHYDREAQLAFRVPGRIAAYRARIGDRLTRGAVLATLDPTPYAAAEQRAAANMDRAGRAAGRYAALAQEGAAAGAQALDGADQARAAQAELVAARYDLQSTRLTMPFSGVITARRGETGESVMAGQTLLTVADTGSPLLASAEVPAAQAQDLKAGQMARVGLADGRTVEARLLRKSAAANAANGLVTVDLVLPTSARALSGSAASASFAPSVAPPVPTPPVPVLRIPVESLLEAQGETAYVYVIDAQGRARRQTVRLLGLVDRDARITGLAPSARVITMGAGFVRHGQKVEVTR